MRKLRVLLLTGIVTVAACGGGDEEAEVRDAAQVAADSAAASALLTPVRGVSLAEVEFGDMAAQRSASPEVRQYAQTVAADHRALVEALDSVAALHRATLVETGATQELANTARMAHSGLEALAGSEFELPFIRAEVETHRLLLDELDQQLIPSARHPELNALLTDIRAMVDAHLARARQLLAQQLGEAEEPAADQTPAPAGQPIPPPSR